MSVLILGATSPIARATARQYAERGQSVFLAGRDLVELERIAADIKLRYAVKADFGPFDATRREEHRALLERAEESVGPIDVALIAFGLMGTQQDSEQDFEQAARVLEVNYLGAASICEALAQVMAHRGGGSILGISSVAGDRGRKSNYFYGSAKGGFTLYLQGLRNRLHERGVHVMTIKLGFVDTPMTFGMETAIPIASPEKVAKAIVAAQTSRRDVLYYPHFWQGVMTLIRHIPEGVFKRLSL